jgi:hypothetical protein
MNRARGWGSRPGHAVALRTFHELTTRIIREATDEDVIEDGQDTVPEALPEPSSEWRREHSGMGSTVSSDVPTED